MVTSEQADEAKRLIQVAKNDYDRETKKLTDELKANKYDLKKRREIKGQLKQVRKTYLAEKRKQERVRMEFFKQEKAKAEQSNKL